MYLAQSTNWGHFPDRIGTVNTEMVSIQSKICLFDLQTVE